MVNVTTIEIPRPSSIRLEPRICRLDELCLVRGTASLGATSSGGVVADSMKQCSCSNRYFSCCRLFVLPSTRAKQTTDNEMNLAAVHPSDQPHACLCRESFTAGRCQCQRIR